MNGVCRHHLHVYRYLTPCCFRYSFFLDILLALVVLLATTTDSYFRGNNCHCHINAIGLITEFTKALGWLYAKHLLKGIKVQSFKS